MNAQSHDHTSKSQVSVAPPELGMEFPGYIRVLHVEDSADDAYLVERHLKNAGIKAQITRVDTMPKCAQSMESHTWDLIFADCNLSAFGVVDVLAMREKSGRDVPVIVVTGSIGEEEAVEFMVAGVEDIIIKGNWSRLVPAVRRTLASSQRKREKERADRELLLSHEKIKRQMEQLSALRLIDSSIKGSFDLRITLEVILDRVVQGLKVSAAALLLIDPESKAVSYKSARGIPTSLEDRWAKDATARRSSLIREIRLRDIESEPEIVKSHPFLKECPFRAYYAIPLGAKGETVGVLEIFHTDCLNVDDEWINFLETLAGQAAIAISDAGMFERLQRSNMELTVAYDQTIEGWSRALDLRDKETEGHSRRVTDMTVALAIKRGISGRDLQMVRWGALLHDIGKMGVPDHILLKPGPLSEAEWKIMKLHPTHARDLLRPIQFLRPALDIPYCHHEKWDGSGYPRGLRGEAIPLAARMFAVVDVWDALSSDRPYRSKWPGEKIRSHMQGLRGTHFESDVLDYFLEMMAQAP